MDLNAYRKADLPKELPFSDAEYTDRLAKVRKKMAEQDVDCLLVHHMPNVCYLTGYQTPMCDWYVCLVIPASGDVHLQVCDLPLAVVTTNVKNITNTFWDRMPSAVDDLVKIVKSLSPAPKRLGLEFTKTGLRPHGYELIKSSFPNATFVDTSDLVAGIRLVKSPAEVDCARRAGQFTVAGINAAVRALAPGITENTLAAAGAEAMIAAGSEFFSIDPFVRAGHRSGILHASYKRTPIGVGDPIVLEFGAVYQRYTSPKYVTAVIGKPSPRLQDLSKIALETIDALYANLRPGRLISEVCRTAGKNLATVPENIEMSRHRHGYAVGIGFPPDWVEHSVTLGEEVEVVLQPGMVFHTPRSLRVPGVMAPSFSETVLITDKGYEVLTPCGRDLVVV